MSGKFSLVDVLICCAILFNKQVRCNDSNVNCSNGNDSNNNVTGNSLLYKYKNVLVILNGYKFIFNRNNGTTVSKFPPILEYLLQKIQSMNSNYIYEDLSRPPTYDSLDFNKTTPRTSSTTTQAFFTIDDDAAPAVAGVEHVSEEVKPYESYQYSTESLVVDYHDRKPNLQTNDVGNVEE